MQIAGAVDRDRQPRRAQPPEPAASATSEIERVGGRILERERGDEDDFRPARAQARRARRAVSRGLRAARPVRQSEFERVGRHDVG